MRIDKDVLLSCLLIYNYFYAIIMVSAFEQNYEVAASMERDFAKASKYTRQNRTEDLLKFLDSKSYHQIDNLRDINGKTILMEAASNADLDTVKAIVARCQDVNHFDCLGRNALHFAAAAKKIETIGYLASEDVEIDVDKQSEGGVTPLINAVKSGDVNTVKEILNNNGNPFFRDIFGREPLDQAAGNAAIKQIIEAAKQQWINQLGDDLTVLREGELPPQQDKFDDFTTI